MKETFEIKWPGVESCLIEESAHQIELLRLRVAKDVQGKGVGSAVIRELKKRNKTIVLIACPDDPERWRDLERFYAMHNFRAGVIDNTYLVWKPSFR